MAIHRCPIIVWRDQEGLFSAAPVHLTDRLAGNAATAPKAVQQVKSYLEWYFREEPDAYAPDFLDPKLLYVTVSLRPEYETRERKYPCSERVDIRAVCVHGRTSGDVLVCTIPMLGIDFHYYEPEMLKRLVVERVRNRLAESSPRQLAQFLAPAEAWLDEVFVKLPKERSGDYVWDERSVPALMTVADPINRRGVRRKAGRAWQRENEISELAVKLREDAVNVVLLGENGVGKSTLLAAAARQAERDRRDKETTTPSDCPYRLWLTGAGRLIAGMQYLGQWEERCEEVIDELSGINGILCVDNLLDLVTQGGLSPADSIAAFLLPYIEQGELSLVGESTQAELDACRRLLPGFADVFQVTTVDELSLHDIKEALSQLAVVEGQSHSVTTEPAAVETIVRLFRRFMPYYPLPGRAVTFVSKLVDNAVRRKSDRVTVDDVMSLFVSQTGLPEIFVRDELTLLAKNVVEHFCGRVMGQVVACRAVASIVTTFKAGLNDADRPLGVLLFCGPTGVGKTEMAKAISDYFFGAGDNDQHFIRLDMSEFSLPGSGDRLLSKSDGSAGELITKVRQQPFSLVLLDEIEKAADDVYDVLLALFDEGRLTDHRGRTASFQSAVIIMTSNLGTTNQASVGFDPAKTPSYEAEVRSFFRPEFFNRIDRLVRFLPLDVDTCRLIVRRELDRVSERDGIRKRGLRVVASDELVEWLLRRGFDDRLGARPLQRRLESEVIATLSSFLVQHSELRDGQLVLSLRDGQVLVELG